ncbi:MAG: hypothetical protein GMKNLPBB_00603 [Myxococcota bacterium]|nr:hypothetical protein [Myxococcota bacterium]
MADEKKPYHHGDLRAALIHAALELVQENGARGLTLREAARRAGVSHAAPYRHFDGKEALIAAVAEEGFRLMSRSMRDEMSIAGSDPAARFNASGVGYLRFAVEHPGHFRLMFSSDVPMDDKYPSLAAAGADSFGVLVECIVNCQQAGVMRAGDVMEIALLCWSQVHGLATLYVEGQLPGPIGGVAGDYRKAMAASQFWMAGGLMVPPRDK